MQELLRTFEEAGKKLHDLRDLATILLDYQDQNNISHSDMGELINWLFEEAILFNIEDSQKKNK